MFLGELINFFNLICWFYAFLGFNPIIITVNPIIIFLTLQTLAYFLSFINPLVIYLFLYNFFLFIASVSCFICIFRYLSVRA